jgi:hypothetical protein
LCKVAYIIDEQVHGPADPLSAVWQSRDKADARFLKVATECVVDNQGAAKAVIGVEARETREQVRLFVRLFWVIFAGLGGDFLPAAFHPLAHSLYCFFAAHDSDIDAFGGHRLVGIERGVVHDAEPDVNVVSPPEFKFWFF